VLPQGFYSYQKEIVYAAGPSGLVLFFFKKNCKIFCINEGFFYLYHIERRGYSRKDKSKFKMNDKDREKVQPVIDAGQRTAESAPMPGDIILLKNGKAGIIERKHNLLGNVCTHFYEPFAGVLDDGRFYLSVSGGPWKVIDLNDLEWHGQRRQWFWTWGREIGAGKGIHFDLTVNVWKIKS
jgi:hypothetical protein